MKGRALILIFLFLLLINPAFAENTTKYFNHTGTQSGSFNTPANTAIDPVVNILTIRSIETMGAVKYVTWTVPEHNWNVVNPIGVSLWETVTIKIGAVTYGTASFGFNNVSGNYHMGIFFNDDCDFSSLSGNQVFDLTGMSTYECGYAPATQDACSVPAGTDVVAVGGYDGVKSNANTWNATGHHDYYTEYDFSNKYTYDTIGVLNHLWVDKLSSLSQWNITGESNSITNDTDVINGNDFHIQDVQNTWTITVYDEYGQTYHDTIVYAEPSAEIEFNQSHYTDPENIVVSGEITNMDTDNFIYLIEMTSTIDGDVSSSFFEASGNWNVSPYITFCCGSVMFDFYSDSYDLPVWIQSNLWAKNKNTGVWTKLANTPAVLYHEKSDFGVGSIWTEKSTYNLSEMFYIFVETDYPIVEVELISDTYHDIQSLEVFEGGWQRVGYAFFSPHNFTAYLYEDGVVTNQTSFSVWTTSPMLNIFLDSEALKTQFAFEFYTDNSSDTITGYKPDGSIFYGPITDLETGDRNIIRGVSSSSPPGIYTISLFHDGTTYYNDTIELYSTSEWVYFEASKYETGDRIKIYSFVTDSRQQVRLTDSIGTAVITWTDSAGYIIPNSQTVLYFSLTDNNEYGMNVNTSIDAGTFRTGNWKVEIIGIDGKPLTNASTYDYTTVSKRIESPADTSNEMISIFFSPEGAFMLFTVCLTMMGLVLSHHPAGGGAGAVVGVGFGVYFNVLPPWMLLLMVIALVVMAGVSIAVYYKGK